MDQPQAGPVHADSGAFGDFGIVDILALCVSAALPVVGRFEQADDSAFWHAFGHSGGESLRAGNAGERPVQRGQQQSDPLALVGGRDQLDLWRGHAACVWFGWPDCVVCGWSRCDW